jgi:hypothetical protein
MHNIDSYRDELKEKSLTYNETAVDTAISFQEVRSFIESYLNQPWSIKEASRTSFLDRNGIVNVRLVVIGEESYLERIFVVSYGVMPFELKCIAVDFAGVSQNLQEGFDLPFALSTSSFASTVVSTSEDSIFVELNKRRQAYAEMVGAIPVYAASTLSETTSQTGYPWSGPTSYTTHGSTTRGGDPDDRSDERVDSETRYRTDTQTDTHSDP